MATSNPLEIKNKSPLIYFCAAPDAGLIKEKRSSGHSKSFQFQSKSRSRNKPVIVKSGQSREEKLAWYNICYSVLGNPFTKCGANPSWSTKRIVRMWLTVLQKHENEKVPLVLIQCYILLNGDDKEKVGKF